MDRTRPKLRNRTAISAFRKDRIAPLLLIVATVSCLAFGLFRTGGSAELTRPATAESTPLLTKPVSPRTNSSAEKLSPEDLASRIDALLAASWKSQGITPAAKTTDSEFVRRA